MSDKIWKAADDVVAMAKDLIAKYHPHLALCDDEIAILFKEKAAIQGEVVVTGKTAKASELFGVLGETNWKFIITLAQDQWVKMSDAERVALLDHHLCGCYAEENKTTGNQTYKVVPPDVSFFRGELERHGLWRTSGAPPTQSLIEEIFGK
jgi:long-subunit acyl-CoA synthetase (AMP-forming)